MSALRRVFPCLFKRRSSGSFAPNNLSNLRLWLKADSLALADSAEVATWSDSSSNAFSFTQATALNRPTYRTNILNSKPVVRCAGSHYLGGPSSIIDKTKKTTYYIVSKQTAAHNGAVMGTIVSADGTILRYTATGEFRNYEGSVIHDFALGGSSTAFNILTIVVGATSTVSGATSFRLNRAAVSTSASHARTAGHDGSLFVGSTLNGDTPLTGDIAEIIVYEAEHTSTEWTQVEGYLATKYGL